MSTTTKTERNLTDGYKTDSEGSISPKNSLVSKMTTKLQEFIKIKLSQETEHPTPEILIQSVNASMTQVKTDLNHILSRVNEITHKLQTNSDEESNVQNNPNDIASVIKPFLKCVCEVKTSMQANDLLGKVRSLSENCDVIYALRAKLKRSAGLIHRHNSNSKFMVENGKSQFERPFHTFLGDVYLTDNRDELFNLFKNTVNAVHELDFLILSLHNSLLDADLYSSINRFEKHATDKNGESPKHLFNNWFKDVRMDIANNHKSYNLDERLFDRAEFLELLQNFVKKYDLTPSSGKLESHTYPEHCGHLFDIFIEVEDNLDYAKSQLRKNTIKFCNIMHNPEDNGVEFGKCGFLNNTLPKAASARTQ